MYLSNPKTNLLFFEWIDFLKLLDRNVRHYTHETFARENSVVHTVELHILWFVGEETVTAVRVYTHTHARAYINDADIMGMHTFCPEDRVNVRGYIYKYSYYITIYIILLYIIFILLLYTITVKSVRIITEIYY